MAKKKRRSPQNTQISISLEKAIVEEIDRRRVPENRTRSNFIVNVLKADLERRKAEEGKIYPLVEDRSLQAAEDPAPYGTQKKKQAKSST